MQQQRLLRFGQMCFSRTKLWRRHQHVPAESLFHLWQSEPAVLWNHERQLRIWFHLQFRKLRIAAGALQSAAAGAEAEGKVTPKIGSYFCFK